MNPKQMIKILDTEPIEVEDIQWRFAGSISFTTEYHTQMESICGRFSQEVLTKRSECGTSTIGSPERCFYIEGDEREFKKLPDLVAAYNEKLAWEQNNLLEEGYKVVWKRIIVKDDAEIEEPLKLNVIR